jgi:hypothetical protein
MKAWLRNPYVWCVVLRLALAFAMPRHMEGDSADYEMIASNLAAGHGISRCGAEPFAPTAQRPPLYPLALAAVYLAGFGHDWGPILLNILFDLLSMFLAKAWAERLKLSFAPKVTWVIALCPLLITYGMYPTTENLSMTVFFAALLLTVQERWALAGLAWGALSLCRSYYLLFPFAMLLIPPLKKASRRSVAVLALTSLALPGAWVARNRVVLGHAVFSQGSTVGWQSFQGVCVANFDWWRPAHLQAMFDNPVMSKMIASHCADEDKLAAYDEKAKGVVASCVREHPFQSARNVLAKQVMLFVNWGLFMPYNRVPFLLQQLVNALLFVYWWCAWKAVRSRKSRGAPGLGDALRFSVLGVAYVVAVTLPFAVDARYLLGPFITLLICVLEIRGGPKALVSRALDG